MKRAIPIIILISILAVLTVLFFRKGPEMGEQLGLKAVGTGVGGGKEQIPENIEGYVSGDNLSYNEGQAKENINNPLSNNPSTMEIDTAKKYQATLTTSAGVIVIDLNATATPITVNNFVVLSKKGFYDNTIFHRAIKGFMIQGGDPKGDGTGGPGYTFEDEPFDGSYTRGTVAMANSGPDTNGSQFFIMHADYALPKNYVIFGKVVSGLDVVDKIATAPVKMSRSGEQSQPVTPVVVNSVVITEKE